MEYKNFYIGVTSHGYYICRLTFHNHFMENPDKRYKDGPDHYMHKDHTFDMYCGEENFWETQEAAKAHVDQYYLHGHDMYKRSQGEILKDEDFDI